MTTAYRYQFDADVSVQEVEATLALALVATECLFGSERLRLDAPHYFDAEARACVVSADTPAGRALARLFVGFARREFGSEAFRVERVDRPTFAPTAA